MELHFQQPSPPPPPPPPGKQTKFKEKCSNKIRRRRSSGGGSQCKTKSKFVGVRQRASGKWVAEIKNTTQKIRIWLGTFETAEEAALAYDEAACLLRGSNTRTNLINTPSASSSSIATTNSAISLRIRKLVNQKKSLINSRSQCQSPSTPPSASATSAPAESTKTTQFYDTTPISNSVNVNQPCNSIAIKDSSQLLRGNTYRPELNVTGVQFDCSWAFAPYPISGDLAMYPKHMPVSEVAIPEFERMKVERQISASLYAMNGVNDYMENVLNVGNSSDPTTISTWDLLHHPFRLS